MQHRIVAAGLVAALPVQVAALKGRADDNTSFGPLKFSEDGTFQISILEDLHFGNDEVKDDHTIEVMKTVLDAEPADFVVINGDLVDRASTFRENRTDYIHRLLEPLVDRDLTWGSTYGNHDHTVNTSASMILETEHKYPNSRTRRMVFGREAGISNYYLPVYASDCSGCDCVPELLLWFFDSRGGFYYGEHKPDGSFVEQPSWVDGTVATWFQQESTRIAAKFDKVIPSLAFVHIPIFASEAFGMTVDVDEHLQPGINDTMPMAQQGYGFCPDGRYDPTCLYGGQDVPFMQAIASTPGMMALFNAHEHGNTWCYKWDALLEGMAFEGNGVSLCFGQHTGYAGAGDWIRGARQVRLSKEMLKDLELETWIRLEDERIVGAVSLNATYNEDRYPATPNDKTYVS